MKSIEYVLLIDNQDRSWYEGPYYDPVKAIENIKEHSRRGNEVRLGEFIPIAIDDEVYALLAQSREKLVDDVAKLLRGKYAVPNKEETNEQPEP